MELSKEYKNMKNILAFGDSNTWGLIPGTKERYSNEIRWTGLDLSERGLIHFLLFLRVHLL